MTEELEQVREIQKAFEQEFERFADLSADDVAIGDADTLLREVGELKIRHTGKKSAIVFTKSKLCSRCRKYKTTPRASAAIFSSAVCS